MPKRKSDEMKREIKSEDIHSLLTDSEDEIFQDKPKTESNDQICSSDEEKKPKKKRRPRKMRKTIERDDFGDENEIPVGLSYIQNVAKEAKITKRQSLKAEKDKGNAPNTRSTEVDAEQNKVESDDSEKDSNEYKRRETRNKNRVDFSDSDDESENKTDFNSDTRLAREATPPPEDVAMKKRQTKIAKNTRKLESDMKGALAATGSKDSDSVQDRYQNYLRYQKNDQKPSSGKKDGERRIQVSIKLPNQAKPIKTDFNQHSLFLEMKQIISAENKIPLPFYLQLGNERFDDFVCLKDVESKIGFTPIEVIPDDSPQEQDLGEAPAPEFSVVFKYGEKDMHKLQINCEVTDEIGDVIEQFHQKHGKKYSKVIFDGDIIPKSDYKKTLSELDIDDQDCIEVRN